MTSFSGGGSRREPPTMGKQLVNFITCGCESSAPFFAIYKPRLLCNSYTCQLYIFYKVDQLLAHGRWFSPASSTTKTGHDIAENIVESGVKTQKI
jgi:hypothetical protein